MPWDGLYPKPIWSRWQGERQGDKGESYDDDDEDECEFTLVVGLGAALARVHDLDLERAEKG